MDTRALAEHSNHRDTDASMRIDDALPMPAVDSATVSASRDVATEPESNIETVNANGSVSTPTNGALDANINANTNANANTAITNADTTSAFNANTADTKAPTKTAPPVVARRRRGHRTASSVWGLLTLDPSPHLEIASTCRHCDVRVPHHHKSEKARAHLTRCVAFRQTLVDADANTNDNEANDATTNADMTNVPYPIRLNDAQLASFDVALSKPESNRRPTKRLKPTTATARATTAVLFSPPDPLAVMDALAMYIYTTGTAFSHIDNPHLRRALELASGTSSVPLPRAQRDKDLTGAVLDRAFAAVQCDLLRVTQRAKAVNALCVNSWLPPIRESVYLVGDTERTVPLFVDAAPHVDDPHVLFDRLARALPLCGDNIHGMVTDNSHANQLTWAKFKTIFPAKFFHGCAAHGVYLFIQEIFGSPDTETTTATTAFADLRRLVNECREMVAFFKSDQVKDSIKASLAAKLSDANKNQLEMPPPNQWFELKAGFESVLVVLPTLQKLSSAQAFTASGDTTTKQRIAELVNRSYMETLLFKAVALVDPLDKLLHRLEKDPATPISDVFYWFAKELPVALSRVPGVSDDEAAYLLHINQIRFNAMYGDSHGMAYLLDPRYVGEGLSPDVRKNIDELIFQTPLIDATKGQEINSEDHKRQIALELREYVADATKEKAENSARYSMLLKTKQPVLQYWRADGQRWPLLQQLATRLFALPASTLPMTKSVLSVPVRVPQEDLSPEVLKKIKFIQLNQVLLRRASGARR